MTTADLVIFDCDGVLVDSEAIGNRVLSETLAIHGVVLSPAATQARFKGFSVGAIRREVEKDFDVGLPDDWTEAYYARLVATLAAEAVAIEGVAAVVALLQAAGVPFCVASQGPLEKTEASLTSAGLWPAFAGRAFSAKTVARPKPAPDLLLKIAEQFGAAPKRCVVIEDSPTGVTAAVAAAMRCLAFCAEEEAKLFRGLGAVPFHAMADLPDLLQISAER